MKDDDIRAKLPPMAVGVMGSAGGDISGAVRNTVRKLGEEVALRGAVLVTGAAPGLPHDAVLGAKAFGGRVIGISPALNFREHVLKYKAPTQGYDLIVYTGSGLMGREIEISGPATSSCLRAAGRGLWASSRSHTTKARSSAS